MERSEIEAAAALFKKEVDAAVQFFYAESPDAVHVEDVKIHDWGFTYVWDGAVLCAVRFHDGKWEDHADIGVNERGELDSWDGGYVVHPTFESLIAGLIANQADSIDDYDITVEQRAERDRLHALDQGVFITA